MPETQIPGLQNTSAERRNSKFHKSLDILDYFRILSKLKQNSGLSSDCTVQCYG